MRVSSACGHPRMGILTCWVSPAGSSGIDLPRVLALAVFGVSSEKAVGEQSPLVSCQELSFNFHNRDP